MSKNATGWFRDHDIWVCRIQLDDDGDGVSNLDDLCPSSSQGALVALNGCEIIQETNTESAHLHRIQPCMLLSLYYRW